MTSEELELGNTLKSKINAIAESVTQLSNNALVTAEQKIGAILTERSNGKITDTPTIEALDILTADFLDGYVIELNARKVILEDELAALGEQNPQP